MEVADLDFRLNWLWVFQLRDFKTAENDPCIKMQATCACLLSYCHSKMATLSHALLVL